MHNTVSIGWRSNRAALETASEAGALLNSKGRRRNRPSSRQVSRSPSSVLPSHDCSRTQQRSRLKCKEKLGFAIPVGHFQTVQAGHRHAHCGQRDNPPRAKPLWPLCPLWWPSFLRCGLARVSVRGYWHTSMRRGSEEGHARTVQRGIILLQPQHQLKWATKWLLGL